MSAVKSAVTKSSIPRILVISPNWIGDAVMAQPLLQLLRQRYPERPIDVLAPAWVAPVWKAMQEVDTVVDTPFKHGKLQLGQRWEFARRLRQRGYAEAYVLPNTLKFALIPWLAGIPRRIGYKGEMRYGLLNVMHHDDPAAPRPMVPFYAALAAPPSRTAPAHAALPKPTLFVQPEQMAQAAAQFGVATGQPLVVFAPGAEFGSAKRWPATHFAALARTVRQHHPGAQILLLGSGKDKAVCDKIIELVPEARNLAGATSLSDAIALIAHADAVISNDSGLMHIACGLNRPGVVIYGPTSVEHAPPASDLARALSLRLECSPCKQRECPLGHHRCMKDINEGMVWELLQPMMNANKSR
jgi:heptosyltransferase-2